MNNFVKNLLQIIGQIFGSAIFIVAFSSLTFFIENQEFPQEKTIWEMFPAVVFVSCIIVLWARWHIRRQRLRKEVESLRKYTESMANKSYLRGVAVQPLISRPTSNFVSNSSIQNRKMEKPNKMKSFDAFEYELYCLAWMRSMGAQNVRLTKKGADGGVDIESDRHVAQVKFHAKPIAVQPIREIFGVAAAQSKRAVFFTSAGYTPAAIDFAEKNLILLFVCDPLTESLISSTRDSQMAFTQGLI